MHYDVQNQWIFHTLFHTWFNYLIQTRVLFLPPPPLVSVHIIFFGLELRYACVINLKPHTYFANGYEREGAKMDRVAHITCLVLVYSL